MRLRILQSVVLAAALLAAELVVLALYLNPGVRVGDEPAAVLFRLFLPWTGMAAIVLLPLALVLPWLPLPREVPRPLFPSMPWLGTLLLVAIALSAALFWWNLLSYRHSVPVAAVRGLLGSAVALTAGVLVLVGVGLDVVLFPARRRGVGPGVVLGVVGLMVLVPIFLRPRPQPDVPRVRLATEPMTAPVRRVTLLGVDGLGPEQVRDGVARGTLPGLARLFRRGAHGPLATLRPTEAAPIWTSIATGLLPRDHGVKSSVSYKLQGGEVAWELLPKGALVGVLERLRCLERQPVTSASRRRTALWQAVDAFGLRAGVVRYAATFPAEPIRGFMVTPYHHLLAGDPAQAARSMHPDDLLEEVGARVVHPEDVDAALLAEFVDPAGEEDEQATGAVRRALAADLSYNRAGEVLRLAYAPHLFVTYASGLDVVGHAFTRHAQPERFGDVSPEVVRKYGRVTGRYAALVSEWVDARARTLESDELLLVVSGHGMDVVPGWRRVLDLLLGEGEGRTGTHDAAPDGYLLAVGAGVRAGASIEGASVVDVAPTLLYLMGLPVGRDMEGRVLTEMLEDGLARSQPVTYVPSYESLAVRAAESRSPLELPPLPEEMP